MYGFNFKRYFRGWRLLSIQFYFILYFYLFIHFNITSAFDWPCSLSAVRVFLLQARSASAPAPSWWHRPWW